MPRIPTDEEIGLKIQQALVASGVPPKKINVYLRELWGLERHHVYRILNGQHYAKPDYIRQVCEATGTGMKKFYE